MKQQQKSGRGTIAAVTEEATVTPSTALPAAEELSPGPRTLRALVSSAGFQGRLAVPAPRQLFHKGMTSAGFSLGSRLLLMRHGPFAMWQKAVIGPEAWDLVPSW